MSISEELEKLAKLHEQGALSKSEFEAAKRAILAEASPTPERRPGPENSLGNAANKYVDFEITMKKVGLVFGILIFLFFFLPMACSMQNRMSTPFPVQINSMPAR